MRVAELAKQYENDIVPRPPHWGGLRLLPDRVEFWKNRLSRLHDREVYWRKAVADPWRFERLYP
jgi:pyridoxamine 5'-phosphate oxidase